MWSMNRTVLLRAGGVFCTTRLVYDIKKNRNLDQLDQYNFQGNRKNALLSTSPSEANKDANIYIEEVPVRTDRKAPRYPIILCHGFSGFDKLFLVPSFNSLKALITKEKIEENILEQNESGIYFEYWNGIQKALIANGTVALIAKVPPMGTIEVRAQALNEFIERQIVRFREDPILSKKLYEGTERRQDQNQSKNEPIKVNLIAHSMGGLDSRYLIAKLEQHNYKVVSLTTVSTPHRGSEVADYIVNLLGSKESPPELITYSDFFGGNKGYRIPLVPPSIFELTTFSLRKFNNEIKDDPNVKYFSYGARFFPGWTDIFKFTYNIIKDANGGDNDGLVSTDSARWGKYMGTIENADHLDLINWKNSLKLSWRERVYLKKDKFDAVALYLNIADDLARHGF